MVWIEKRIEHVERSFDEGERRKEQGCIKYAMLLGNNDSVGVCSRVRLPGSEYQRVPGRFIAVGTECSIFGACTLFENFYKGGNFF